MITHPELVSRLCKPGEDILDTLTPKKCHLWHMMTGLVGEVIELKEAWLKQDVPNIIEELGDIRFYIQGFIQTFDVVDSIKYYNEPLAKEPIDTIFLLCGEIVDVVKRHIIYNAPLQSLKLHELLFTTIVRLNTVYEVIGVDDFVVTEANTTKLSTRYPELCFTDKHAALRLDKSSEE